MVRKNNILKFMSKEIENYWNATAQKYQKKSGISLASAHYGPYAPQEKDLKLLGNVRNKKILEIGCGVPRSTNNRAKTSMTFAEFNFRSTSMAKHSRVNSSMMLSILIARPLCVLSITKS